MYCCVIYLWYFIERCLTFRIGTIHEDVTTEVVGKIGSWQWLVTFVTTMLMVPAIFNQYEDIFPIYPSDATCIPHQDYEVLNSSLCYVTNGTDILICSKWNMKLMWFIRLKRTWLVFCDTRMRSLSTSIICRFGCMFGCIIYGFIADSFGRKIAIIMDQIASLGLSLVITFCDSEGWFRLLVFLKSVFGSASSYMGLLLISEISSNSWRSTLSTIVTSPRLFGMVCMTVLTSAAPNPETYSFLSCLYAAVCIILLKWCPESPQWLLHNRKIHLAEKVLKRAAKLNGIRLCTDFKIRPVDYRAYNSLDEVITCIGVLATQNVRTIFMVLSSFWVFYFFVWSCLYVKVYREENLTYLVLGVLCCASLFVCLTTVLSKKLTLKNLLLIHTIVTGALATCLVFFNKGVIRSIGSAVAISSGAFVHALLLNTTPRLFAVNIRATMFGCCHAIGQLGSVASFTILLFHPMDDVTYSVAMAVLTVALSVLCCLLPDVDGRELPDLIEDMDFYSELSKPLRWACQKTSSTSTEEVQIRVYSFGSAGTNSSISPEVLQTPPHPEGLIGRRAASYLRRIFKR